MAGQNNSVGSKSKSLTLGDSHDTWVTLILASVPVIIGRDRTTDILVKAVNNAIAQG